MRVYDHKFYIKIDDIAMLIGYRRNQWKHSRIDYKNSIYQPPS